jgi:hypothetical protein
VELQTFSTENKQEALDAVAVCLCTSYLFFFHGIDGLTPAVTKLKNDGGSLTVYE